jgi:hypothetical protein
MDVRPANLQLLFIRSTWILVVSVNKNSKEELSLFPVFLSDRTG